MDSQSLFECKKVIQNAFKLSGFLLDSDLCGVLIEKSQEECSDFDELRSWVEKIIKNLQKQELEQPVIQLKNITEAIKECGSTNTLKVADYLNVIHAFEFPKFVYDRDRRKIVHCEKKLQKHPKFSSKVSLFIDRYNTLLQQIERNDMFDNVANRNKGPQLKLITVEGLITSIAADHNETQHFVVFGMLTRLNDNKIYLEDPTANVELDLSSAEFNVGIYTEDSFVMIDGEYDDGVFKVAGISHPPVETHVAGKLFTTEVNTFGGDLEKKFKQNFKQLEQIESQYRNHSFVFLSEVWLNSPEVISKLKQIFEGYNDYEPPFMFIFMGNFTSPKLKDDPGYALRELLKQLGEIIQQYDKILKSSIFLFIAGPTDPTSGKMLPRRALPEYITEEFRKRVPNCIFSTSPCRVRYCTKEILIIREDVHSKICRNALHMPSANDTDINLQFVKTIINQNHLTPMTPLLCPNYWDYDHCLSLYPLPDLVVIADDTKGEYTYDYKGCKVSNPGSFSKNNYSFQWYQPATHEVENSGI